MRYNIFNNLNINYENREGIFIFSAFVVAFFMKLLFYYENLMIHLRLVKAKIEI